MCLTWVFCEISRFKKTTWQFNYLLHRDRSATRPQGFQPADPAASGLPGSEQRPRVAKAPGFPLHAGLAAAAHERQKLERLCRYITRPAMAEQRLSLTAQGRLRYQLKTPYRDGTTHVVLESLDFIVRLAALVPKTRVNLIK